MAGRPRDGPGRRGPLAFACCGRAAGALANACRAAGLQVQWQRTLSLTLKYPSADEACDAMFVAGPAALAWSRFDEDSRARVRARYLEAIDPWRRGSGYELSTAFVCLVATAMHNGDRLWHIVPTDGALEQSGPPTST
jgi:hypothetical protein